MELVKKIVRLLFIFSTNIFSPIQYFTVLLIGLPLLFFNPRWFWKMESYAYASLNSVVPAWFASGGFKIIEMGEDPENFVNQECIVMANHQNTCDVPALICWMNHNFNAAMDVMWIIDVIFKWSHFGVVSSVHRDYFIEQGRHVRQASVLNLRRHLKNWFTRLRRKWIMIFPEGGFLYKRLESSQEYARKNGFPVLQHTTLPRVGAIKAILEALDQSPNRMKYIIDITVAYDTKEGVNLGTLFTGSRKPFCTWVYNRAFATEDIPRDEHDLLMWLYDRWVEKERLLDHFYKHGVFPVLDGDAGGLRGKKPSFFHEPREMNFSTPYIVNHMIVYLIIPMIEVFYALYHIFV